jgi:IclR family KDG regulon transcriptional repressor
MNSIRPDERGAQPLTARKDKPAATNGERSIVSVRAVTRAVAILRAFTPGRPALTLSEVAEAVALDVGTSRRLLLTLVDLGMVTQNPATSRYCLGNGIVELSRAVPEGLDIRQIAAPLLAELAQATRATIFLAIEADQRALCLERLHGQDALVQVRWWNAGQSVDLTVGAGPRTLLAGLPDAQIETLLAANIPKRAPGTVTKPSAIRQEIDEIRARGWALSVEESIEGISAVAAPILDRSGATVAAVSIAGLTAHILPRGKTPYLADLLACTKGISARLP